MWCLKKLEKYRRKKEGTAKFLGLSFMRMLASCVWSLKENDGGRCSSVRVYVSYRCALPKPTHGMGSPKAVGHDLWRGTTVLDSLQPLQGQTEQVSCARRILADLETSLGLVVGFINAKYFSMEALGCSHVNWFLMLILVSAAWIWRYLLISLPMSPTLHIFNKDENFCKVVKASCTWEVRMLWVPSTWKTLSWGF